MLLSQLLQEAGYVLPAVKDMEISGIASDSRLVREGELFVAIPGTREDGYTHIGQALCRGAVFVVAERGVPGAPHLRVNNAREALARLFDAWYGHPARDMCLIGITGTNGKTSTAAMLAAIIRESGEKCGVIGTVGCFVDETRLAAQNANRLANLTTPDPAELYRVLAEMRDVGVSFVVMEVTSHALYFEKIAPLCFTRAAFTNLTPDHMDLHGDMETYFGEKRKLFERCHMGIISLFGPYGQALADSLSVPFYTIGRGTVSDVLTSGVGGVSFSFLWQGEKVAFSLPVPGDFSVENAALAAMCALSLSIEVNVVKAALASFGGVRGRMERYKGETGGVYVFFDYAHTPDALEKLLLSVRRFREPGQRIILLFGCGGDRDRSKRRKMGKIATRLSDLTIITSDNARSEQPAAIIAEVVKGIDKEKPYKIVEDRKEAISYAVSVARAGDILLLVGKGHEEYEIVGRHRLPFSEQEIVKDAFAQKYGEEEI